MSGFRKFCTVVFFLSFLLSVGALAADWFAFKPVGDVVEGYRGQDWFNVILLVLLAVSALGMIVVLVSTLVARSKNSYQETANDLGSVCISRSALQRTVEDVIYAHPELTSLKTMVRIVNRKKSYVDITARVAPRGLVSLATVAPILQKEIKDAVEKLTGNEVRSVVVDIHENKNANDVMTFEEEEQMQRNIHAAHTTSVQSKEESVAEEPERLAPGDAVAAPADANVADDALGDAAAGPSKDMQPEANEITTVEDAENAPSASRAE